MSADEKETRDATAFDNQVMLARIERQLGNLMAEVQIEHKRAKKGRGKLKLILFQLGQFTEVAKPLQELTPIAKSLTRLETTLVSSATGRWQVSMPVVVILLICMTLMFWAVITKLTDSTIVIKAPSWGEAAIGGRSLPPTPPPTPKPEAQGQRLIPPQDKRPLPQI